MFARQAQLKEGARHPAEILGRSHERSNVGLWREGPRSWPEPFLKKEPIGRKTLRYNQVIAYSPLQSVL